MSLKKAVCKDAHIEMECKSKSTNDTSGVHLEDNFLFSLSFLLLETEVFDRCGITFFYKWLKDAL